MRHLAAALCAWLGVLASCAFAGDDPRTLRLTTAEWPPYLGESLPGQGALAVILREALAAEGHGLELRFFPWARAVQQARNPRARYDGYVVDYYGADVARDFLLSKPLFRSPLVLAERADRPLAWQSVADLRRYRLGLVSGYINTPEIDALVARGEIAVEFVASDADNLRRLAAGRVDAVTVDRYVLAWLLRHDRTLARPGVRLQVSGSVLEEKALFACFRRTARGEALKTVLDSGMGRVDVRRRLEEYLRQYHADVTGAR